MCMQWKELQLVYRTDGSMQLIISFYYILLYEHLQWTGVYMTTWIWVKLINWMSLQGFGYGYKCELKYVYSYRISSQLIIFLWILCVCVCACMHARARTCACACTCGEGWWQAHQLGRLFAHVGRIKYPEHTYTHVIVRRAKIEIPESKKSYVHYLLITGCQKSYKWQAVWGPVAELTLNIPRGGPLSTPEGDFLWSCRNYNN